MNKAKYIDPIIGTVGDEQSESFHGGGKTYPGACLPGGMVQLSPDTVSGGDNGTGYNYCHNTIEGFSFNRMSGIGWYGDLGNLQVMPVVGDTDLRSGSNEELPFVKGKEGWKSEFSHERETAKAGSYSVWLERYGIFAEATVTMRTGILRFTYPNSSDARAIINFSRRMGGHADFEKIDIVNDRRIEGEIICTPAGGGFGRGDAGISYNFYFAMEFSVPAKNMRFFANEELAEENISRFENEDAGLIVSFGDELKEPVMIKCGISYNDLDGARKNLETECPDFDFDGIKKAAFDEWGRALEAVKVEGSDETDLKIFYTCLYHTLLDPRCAADIDGRFKIGDDIRISNDYTHRTVFSGWDVYRSEFPLLSLIRPDVVNDEVNSLLNIALYRNRSFPKWELLSLDTNSMVGDPGLIVVADAYIKGIRNYDAEKAYEISKASSLVSKELFGRAFRSVRPDLQQYKQDAFVPERLSDTLEFLLADYTLSRFAKSMNKKDDEAYFSGRAKRFTENFDPSLGFMAPRNEDGSFMSIIDEYDDEGCVESNIYQQSWFVPYDVIGLCDLFGKKRSIELLERFFEKADLGKLWNEDYNHSNEPCHNITHYFDMLGLAHRTQYWTRRVQKEAYRTGAFGFCGNEDVGQLSAWYVLSAFGFAQLCPAYDAYFINTPLFKRAEMKLDPTYHSCGVSDTLVVECDKDPLEYPYIKAVSFNGKKVSSPYIRYHELTEGGVVSFVLSKEPCDSFKDDVPLTFFD